MRSETVRCADVADDLAGADELLLALSARTHVAECLRCQAELAGYRRLRRTMRLLAHDIAPIDDSLEDEILIALDREGQRLSRRVPVRTAATLGGLAAAAGVIALATRQRRGARIAG